MKHHLVALALAIVLASWMATLRPGNAAAATPPAVSVPQFEYCEYFNSYFDADLLDKFGREGWELAGFSTIGERQVNPDFVGAKQYALVFKRQAGSGLNTCAQTHK